MAIVITVRPNGYGTRGQLYDAMAADRLVVRRSATPLLDACRALLAEGVVTPETPVAMRHEGKDYDALRSTVGAAAKLTVSDSDTGRPKFKTFKPWKRGEEIGAVPPPMRQTESPATLVARNEIHAARERPSN
jgi:hypothetical protein